MRSTCTFALVLCLLTSACGSSHGPSPGDGGAPRADAPRPLFEDCASDFVVVRVPAEPGCQSIAIENVGAGLCDGFGTRPRWEGISALLVNDTGRSWAYAIERAEMGRVRYGHTLGAVVDGRGCGICDTVDTEPAIVNGGNISVDKLRLVFELSAAEGPEPLVLHVCSPEELDPDLVYFP